MQQYDLRIPEHFSSFSWMLKHTGNILCHHNFGVSKLCLDFQEIGGNFILAEKSGF